MLGDKESLVLIVNRYGVPLWVKPEVAKIKVALEGARYADKIDREISKDGTIGVNVDAERQNYVSGGKRRGRRPHSDANSVGTPAD